MLKLDRTITVNKDVWSSPNICDMFSKEDLASIAGYVSDNYDADLYSRSAWESRTEAAMDLAMQLQEEKSFPWQGCSNVAFPLVTIAAIQFHARAYPAIVNGRSVVQCRVVGPDPGGANSKRAELIGQHMSWQLLEQDEQWEEDTDRALLSIPIIGCGFKKSYYDAGLGHNVSQFVSAKDLVCNYWAKSIERCPVKTHRFPMSRNDIHERVKRGVFRDVLEEAWYQDACAPTLTESEQKANERTGQEPPQGGDNPFMLLEQHCWLDLDGDGYAEPYIVTLEDSSREVLRIVARFDRKEDIEYTNDGDIIRIRAVEYFTKIPFLPSPDGSIYDIGFGVLLGPLNESVNTAINQLIDAGTMANTAGGFLGRGAKIRGGVYQFSPFSWNRVDSTGDDLSKSIIPLPVREPSAVLFNLLSLLIEYTNRLAGSTDMMVGENPGQNTPAETSRAMIEQGQKIYSAIFKRIWRSLKQEFKKLYQLNAVYLPDREAFGDGGTIGREDYTAGAASVIPAADPTIASDGAKFAQARMLKEAAATTMGYDADAVERRYLRALGIDEVDALFPGAAGMEPQKDVKLQIQELKMQQAMAELEFKKLSFIAQMQEQQRMNAAKIVELNAKAMKLSEEARTTETNQRIQAFNAAIGALKENNEQLHKQIDTMMKDMNNDGIADDLTRGRVVQSLVGTPGNSSAETLPTETEGGA